jgi:hypothetical protein
MSKRFAILLVVSLAVACGGPAEMIDGGVRMDTSVPTDAPVVPRDAWLPSGPLAPMPRISDGLPDFTSDDSDAAAAHDGNLQSFWSTDGPLPVWLAYDVSSLPAAQRQQVLLSFNNHSQAAYFSDPPSDGIPIDYTIEINTGAGGGEPPSAGWTVLVTETNNNVIPREHLLALAGANWVRIVVTRTQNGHVGLDMDLYDASAGFIDGWLIMGDSISYTSLSRWTLNLPQLLADRGVTEYQPFFDCAALGGTNSGDGQGVLDHALAIFAGHFVTLNYGTNDGDPTSYHANMTALVERILAAGKTPVVPTVPWPNDSDGHRATVRMLNEQLEEIYTSHPGVMRGPDLYTYFETHPEYIGVGDVHPDGMSVRVAWADWMASSVYGGR